MPAIERTIVYLQRTEKEEQGNRFQFYLSSPDDEGADIRSPFSIDLQDNPFSKLQDETPNDAPCVRAFGERLYNVLTKHDAVAKRLARILESAERRPIYFHFGPLLDDDLPWETLYCDQVRFIALDSRFPIAQLHDVTFRGTRGTDHTLLLPIKIALVLSGPPAPAADVESQSLLEWESFWSKLAATHFSVPLKIKVLTSDPQVLSQIGRLHAVFDWVSAEPIIDRPTLLHAISEFSPRFLHFYCPCSAGGILEIPTQSDWQSIAQGSPRCEIGIGARQLRNSGDMSESIWAVTLNCIGLGVGPEGEAPPGSRAPRTLARQLIDSAFPVAVTTREPAGAVQARRMFGQFYMDAIQMIAEAAPDGTPHQVEWAAALLEGRASLMLAEHHHDSDDLREYCRHWTTPVLFAGPEPFVIRRQPPGSDVGVHAAAKGRTLRKIVEDLIRDGANADVLDELAARVTEVRRRVDDK